jgi:hypothetical protein
VTTAWDKAHDVIATMGDRFVLIRLDSNGKITRIRAGRQAISNTGSEMEMRAELAEAAGGVIAGMNPVGMELTEDETECLLVAADLVTRARTGVDFDYQAGSSTHTPRKCLPGSPSNSSRWFGVPSPSASEDMKLSSWPSSALVTRCLRSGCPLSMTCRRTPIVHPGMCGSGSTSLGPPSTGRCRPYTCWRCSTAMKNR